MAKEYNRIQRIESLMQDELARIIHARYESLRVKLISITHIKVSPDLSYAKVYLVMHHDDEQKEVLKFLNKEAKSIRYVLAQQIKLRKMPEIHFYYDDALRQGEEITQLLDAIKPE